MAETLARRSPLGTLAGAAGAVLFTSPNLRIVEEPFLAVQSLRLSRRTGDAKAALAALGFADDAKPNTVAGDARRACAWIEPLAWLLLGDAAAPQVAGALLTDLSDRYAVFRVSGRGASSLLAAGCPLDSLGLAPGRAARTRFAEETEAIVLQLSAEPDYRVLFDAGLSRFAADWLADAARLAPAAA